MLKCHDIAHLASDYLERQMSLRARLALALHLLLCGKCRAFIQQLRIALALYPQLKRPVLPPEQAQALTAQVLRKAAEHRAG
ncbi:MAG: anti-sigma factor [Pseudomonadales bacterium]|jgi:predicted anti-sigma-YlaC factor YlaD|nr:anti-sigma factor [Pseudomonadales bacterium]